MSVLQELVGLQLVRSECVEDYRQLWFQNGECLNVYNEHQIADSSHNSKCDDDLIGATLTAVHEDGTLIRLTFSNALEVSIDMREDAYLGPEALELSRPGMPIVVWRVDD